MLCYCKKCGRIVQESKYEKVQICDYCQHKLDYVPDEYLGGQSKGFIIKNLKDQFINEYIKTSPEFDPYLFEHRKEDMFNKRMSDEAKLEHGRAVLEGRDKGNNFGVSCPYCNATNVKKIGMGSRMVSTGLFGLGSKKIGKQWHCNHCGSDF